MVGQEASPRARLRVLYGTDQSSEPFGFVSPHLDDVVMSCGRLLSANPGCPVVTVFSSGPSTVDPLPPWDKGSGLFRPGDDVMGIRRREDLEALAHLRAQAHHLGFWDEQYRSARAVPDDEVATSVEESLHQVIRELGLQTWFVPLGLVHGDHKLVARACLSIARQMSERRWVVYEELPYRSEQPLEVQAARERAKSYGFTLEAASVDLSWDISLKRAAVSCYRSQMKPLGKRARTVLAGHETFLILVRMAP